MFLAPLFAFLGFFAAIEIHFAKQKKTKLACPRTSKCDMVIHSTYAKIGAVSNDILGILFYALVLILLLFFPAMVGLLHILVAIGFAFSLYLLSVQLFVLRTWCAWCLLSALASIGLFICLFFIG